MSQGAPAPSRVPVWHAPSASRPPRQPMTPATLDPSRRWSRRCHASPPPASPDARPSSTARARRPDRSVARPAPAHGRRSLPLRESWQLRRSGACQALDIVEPLGHPSEISERRGDSALVAPEGGHFDAPLVTGQPQAAGGVEAFLERDQNRRDAIRPLRAETPVFTLHARDLALDAWYIPVIGVTIAVPARRHGKLAVTPSRRAAPSGFAKSPATSGG